MNVLFYFHIENEWSYQVINFYQRYVTWYEYIDGVWINDLVCLFKQKCVVLVHMSIYT